MTVLPNLLALSSLAALLCTSGVTSVAAVSVNIPHQARHVSVAHSGLFKRNSHQNTKRCAPRKVPQKDQKDEKSTVENVNNNNNGGNQNNAPAAFIPPPSSTPPSASGKKGLGWPNGPGDLDKWRGINWIYTWSPHCPDNAGSIGVECVPMCWGWKHKDEFIQKTSVDGYAHTALGMNEPNQPGQSDMSPESGVDLWLQALEPLKAKGYRLGSPSTTSAPSGKEWLKRFFEICGGRCSVDFVTLHWYDVGVQKFKDYVTDFHNTFNKNIWVTEYACQNFNGGAQCSDGEVWDFLQQTVRWMEDTPWIERYAWFGAMHDMQDVNGFNQLMGGDGGRNALGNKYIDL